MLELYFATERTEMTIDETHGLIVEESMEGLPIVVAADFRLPADGREGTIVTLKVAYNLPGVPSETLALDPEHTLSTPRASSLHL